MPTYTLEIEATGNYGTDIPTLEIWAEFALDSSHTISSTGSTISVTITYGGALPTSLEFRFNDALPEGGRTIEIQSVKINDKYVNTGNYLSIDSLTNGGAAGVVNVAASDFIFDPSDPAASEFTTGATRTLTAGNDSLRIHTSTADEVFDALAGNDLIISGSGNDKIAGNAGNDKIYAGGGNDLVSGGDDNDRIWGQDGNDELYGGNGNDRIQGGDGNDEIHGGAGIDKLSGNDGDDTITGGAGADLIQGGSGNNILYGGTGNDTIVGGTGVDTIDGGDDDDMIQGGGGADILDGGDGNDTLIGQLGADVIYGGDGDDSIYSGGDNDDVRGGDGDDLIYLGGQDDVANGGAGDDILIGSSSLVPEISASTILSYGGPTQDIGGTVTYFPGGVTLDGNLWKKVEVNYTVTANTVIEFDFRSTLEAEVSAIGFDNDNTIDNSVSFELYGTQTWGIQAFNNYDGSGDWTHYRIDVGSYYTGTFSYLFFTNDDDDNSPASGVLGNGSWANVIIYEDIAGSDVDTIDGGADDDQIFGGKDIDTLSGGTGADVINGNDGADILSGDAGNDIIHGGDGDDVIDGGTDDNEMYGGAGDDTLSSGNDNGDDIFHGGAGTDTADFSNITTWVDVDLSVTVAQNTRRGNDTFSQIENLIGSAQGDDLAGDANDNRIDAGAGGDEIWGNGGTDILNGEAGNDDFWVSGTDAYDDTFNGGADYDEMQFSADAYFNLASTFIDMERVDMNNFDAYALINDGLDFSGMVVTQAGNIYGDTGAENITGTDSGDRIYGLAGTDTLNGGIGNDDIYGGDDADTINGGVGVDDIYGEAGADILNGDDGDDNFYISGTDGIGDTIDGGVGSDDIFLQNNIFLDLTTTFTDTERVVFGGFTITAQTGTGFDLSGMTRNGVSNLYGQAGAENITGTESDDNIYGLAGADTLNGGGGNDNFYISGTDSLGDNYNGGGGTDDEIHLQADVYFNSSNTFVDLEQIVYNGFTIFADVNSSYDLTGITRSGAGTLSGQGGNETITGSESADTMYGLAGDDTLSGGNGNDLIYGGAGADILNGNAGNDDFFMGGTEPAGDTINGGAGTDDIHLTSNLFLDFTTTFTDTERVFFNGFTITANVGTGFDLSGMTRNGASNLYGQGGAENITGTESDDNIYGLAGADTLNGGGGNDNFYISGTDSQGDNYNGGGGGDDEIHLLADSTFNSANSFTNMEQIVFGGFNINIASGASVDLSSMSRSGTGQIHGAAGNETIVGNSNASTIYGFGGVDTITGNGGADDIYGGDGADILVGNGGNDDFFVSGTESLGDSYDGGAGTNYVRMLADSNFNSANIFTNLTGIDTNGFNLLIASGATIDFSGMNRVDGGDVIGAAGVETITGFDNNDVIYGMGGADVMSGGGGNDDFYVTGNDSLGDSYDGGAGTDEIRLYSADAYFNSSNSFTSIEYIVFSGFDVRIASGATVDFTGILRSGGGDIYGDTGAETIHGMDNADFIYAGSGDDNLYGGDGRDELYGEGGADTFFLENATAFNDVERIRDFSTAESDALDIKDLLSGYTFGVDDLTLFVQIVDNGANSDVYVDTTGSGSFAGNQVARLYGITGLTDEVAQETAGYLITN